MEMVHIFTQLISEFCDNVVLDVNSESGKPGLFKHPLGLWRKHNWLLEEMAKDESEYDDDFVQGAKRATGSLQHIATG